MTVAPVTIDALDAVELVECLEFLHDWLGAESEVIAEMLYRYTGGCYSVAELRADLARLAFVLGGDGHRFVEGGPR